MVPSDIPSEPDAAPAERAAIKSQRERVCENTRLPLWPDNMVISASIRTVTIYVQLVQITTVLVNVYQKVREELVI